MPLQNSFNNTAPDGFKFELGSDATGDIYYFNGTKLVRLGIGTDGQLLVVESGVPAWQTGAPPGGNAGGDLDGAYPNPEIGTDVVTFAKMQNISTNVFVGRSTAETGDPEELSVAQAQSMLGLGTAAYEDVGTASGNLVQLDGSGKLPSSVVPSVAFNQIFVVADQAARLALSAGVGDIAKQLDNGLAYMLQSEPASTDGNWIPVGDTTIDAADIVEGTIATARLGSGTANSSSYLRGDQTWQPLPYIVLPTTQVTGTTQAMAANNRYLADNAARVTLTLPATAAQGTVIRVVGIGAGGWRIGQASGQQIYFGNVSTTVGTGGRLDSSHQRDCVDLVCAVSNTAWQVTSSIGNIDVT